MPKPPYVDYRTLSRKLNNKFVWFFKGGIRYLYGPKGDEAFLLQETDKAVEDVMVCLGPLLSKDFNVLE